MSRVIKMGLVLLISIFYGVICFVAAAAAGIWAFAHQPYPFLMPVGIVVICMLVCMGGIRVVGSRVQRRYRAAAYLTGTAVILVLSAATLLPGQSGEKTLAHPPDLRYWSLPTGSTIAYIHIPGHSADGKKPDPIVMLHGGPGVPDLQGDSRYFGQLAESGYDIYVYAQVGSGYSSRLADPSQYTVERDAQDLEAIRATLSADRLILMGHSYGAEVIANYMVDHGGHVSRAVFISPGALDPQDHSDANLTGRLTQSQQWKLYRHLLHPRSLFVYSLLQRNPAYARSLAADEEMDQTFDKVYAVTEPALHCNGHIGGGKLDKLGFYANQVPQSLAAKEEFDPRAQLTERHFMLPVLIVKGGCDYLSWESAMDYRRVFPNSKVVYLPEAGHNLYQDQPEKVMGILQDFLLGRTQQLQAYPDWQQPEDYQTG